MPSARDVFDRLNDYVSQGIFGFVLRNNYIKIKTVFMPLRTNKLD